MDHFLRHGTTGLINPSPGVFFLLTRDPMRRGRQPLPWNHFFTVQIDRTAKYALQAILIPSFKTFSMDGFPGSWIRLGPLCRSYVLRCPHSTYMWRIWIDWCEGCMKGEGYLLKVVQILVVVLKKSVWKVTVCTYVIYKKVYLAGFLKTLPPKGPFASNAVVVVVVFSATK